MLAREGFFQSLTLFSIVVFFCLIDVVWVNPFLIVAVLLLAIFLNPVIYLFLWYIFEMLGTLLGITIGAVAGPSGMTLGAIIGAIGTFIGFILLIIFKVLPFALGIIYAFVIVPQGLILSSWGIGLFFVSILLAYFLLYYLIFGNDIALYGIVITLVVAGLHSQAMSFVLGMAILALAGAIIGLSVPVDIRKTIEYAGILYYMSFVGVFMVGAGSEIVSGVYSALAPLFTFLSPANIITLLFVMNVISGEMKWNSLLFQLMAISFIFYALSGIFLPAVHLPFSTWFTGISTVGINPAGYDRAIETYLNAISPAAGALYKAYGHYLGYAIALLVWALFHPIGFIGGPAFRYNLFDAYVLLVALVVIALAFIFDMITGLTGYSVFPIINKVVPPKVKKELAKKKEEFKAKIEKGGAEMAKRVKIITAAKKPVPVAIRESVKASFMTFRRAFEKPIKKKEKKK